MLQSFTHIQFCTVSIRKSQACLWWRTLWWTSTSSGFCISNAYIFRVFGYNQESAKAARNLQRLYTCICCYCFSCWQMSTRFSPPQTDANANASTHAHTCTHRHAHTYTNSICAQKSLRQPAAVTLGTNKNKYNIRNRRAAQCATAANYSIFAHIIYLLRNGIFYCISFSANLKLLLDFLFIPLFNIFFISETKFKFCHKFTASHRLLRIWAASQVTATTRNLPHLLAGFVCTTGICHTITSCGFID